MEFIWVHDYRGFNPWSFGPITLSPWWGRISWLGLCGRAKLITHGVWEGMRRERGGRRRKSWRSRRNREREGRKEERPQTKCSCPKIYSSNKVPPPTISTNRTPTPPQAIVKTNSWSNPSKLLIPQTCCVGDWPFNTWGGLDTSNPDFNNSGTHEKYYITTINYHFVVNNCIAVLLLNDGIVTLLQTRWPTAGPPVLLLTTPIAVSAPHSLFWVPHTQFPEDARISTSSVLLEDSLVYFEMSKVSSLPLVLRVRHDMKA